MLNGDIMFKKNKNEEKAFRRNLEKRLKDNHLVEHLISFYDKQIEEMVISLFLYHLNNDVCLSDDYLTRYSFLLKNEHYLEANHRNRFSKTREFSNFDLFELYFERHFEKIKEGMEECDGFEGILNDKKEIMVCFHETKELNEKKENFLKLRKNPILSKFMDVITIMFLGLGFSLLYQIGINNITLSIAVCCGLTFSFIQSSGEYFEKNRFKYKINKIFPKTFVKSINFVSSLYMSLYLLITVFMLVFTAALIAGHANAVFGFENEMISKVSCFLLTLLSGYWQFRKSIYEKRYFMFKNLERRKSRDDIYKLLNEMK